MASTSAERNIQSTTLPNGLKIITEEMGHVRSVSVGIWIDSGSRREVGPENGISHFIEHMVFKGTATRSAEEIARSIDSLGGNLDAFTGKELVSFNTKVLDEHVPVAFEVLADMVLRPAFRPEDIDKEKGVILEELKMERERRHQSLASKTKEEQDELKQMLLRKENELKKQLKTEKIEKLEKNISKIKERQSHRQKQHKLIQENTQ